MEWKSKKWACGWPLDKKLIRPSVGSNITWLSVKRCNGKWISSSPTKFKLYTVTHYNHWPSILLLGSLGYSGETMPHSRFLFDGMIRDGSMLNAPLSASWEARLKNYLRTAHILRLRCFRLCVLYGSKFARKSIQLLFSFTDCYLFACEGQLLNSLINDTDSLKISFERRLYRKLGGSLNI